MVPRSFQRGTVWEVALEGVDHQVPVLIVSNNGRNRKLNDVVVVRVARENRAPGVDTVVPLTHQDCGGFGGFVMCDSISNVRKSQFTDRTRGAVSPATMRRVATALRAALSI